MQELTPKQIHHIKEMQNEMAIEGYHMTWEDCVEAFWESEARQEAEARAQEPAVQAS